MKKIGFLLILLFALTSNMEAQKSPKSVANGTIDKVDIEINYGAPSVRGRAIWGNMEKYGKVWRAGANDNTTVSFSKKVMIDGKEFDVAKLSPELQNYLTVRQEIQLSKIRHNLELEKIDVLTVHYNQKIAELVKKEIPEEKK